MSQVYTAPRKNVPKTSSPKHSNSQRSLSSLTDEDLVAKAAAQLPGEMIAPRPETSEQFSAGIKKHKYPPLLPELDSPSMSLGKKLPGLQNWERSKVAYGTNKTSSAPEVGTWSFSKESEGMFHEYWQPSSYYDAYDVNCGTSGNWPVSGGYIVNHNTSDDTWQKTLIHTPEENVWNNNSTKDSKYDRHHGRVNKSNHVSKRRDQNAKKVENINDIKPSQNLEPDPRPPGEEDKSFDRSFDKVNKCNSKTKDIKETNNLTESVTDIVKRLSS